MSRRGSAVLAIISLPVLVSSCTLATDSPDTLAELNSPPGVAVPASPQTGSYEYRDDPRTPPQGHPLETVGIRMSLPASPTLSAGVTLLSPRGRHDPDASGDAGIPVADASAPLTAIIVDPATDGPMAVAYVPGREAEGVRDLGAAEVVLGSMALNPALMLAPADVKEGVLADARQHPEFAALVADTEALWAEHAVTFLQSAVDSGLFARTIQVSVDALNARTSSRERVGDDDMAPYIDDPEGPSVEFVNPRLCAYGVEVRDPSGALLGSRVVYGKESLFVVQDAWPPIVSRDPVRESYALGDGAFTVTFYKGFNFATLGLGTLDPETAAGRATIVNTLNLVSLLPGGLDFAQDIADRIREDLPDDTITTVPLELLDSVDWLLDNLGSLAELQGLEANIGNYRLTDVIEGIMNFLLAGSNLDTLAQGLWDSLSPEVTGPFLTAFQQVMRIVDGVFAVLDFANMGAPFIYDFIAAPFVVSYSVQQVDGVLSEAAELAQALAIRGTPDVPDGAWVVLRHPECEPRAGERGAWLPVWGQLLRLGAAA